MSSATIAIANSAGVFAPNFKPMGRLMDSHCSSVTPREVTRSCTVEFFPLQPIMPT